VASALDPLVLIGVDLDDFELDHCEGHCDSSDDCVKGLKCIQRDEKGDEYEPLLRRFGCTGSVHSKADYCVDPDKKLKEGEYDLLTQPTLEPTLGPTTPLPTDRPTTRAERRPRRWTDVMPSTVLMSVMEQDVETDGSSSISSGAGGSGATMKLLAAAEADPFRFTEMPSASPSDAPSASPTDYPTHTPTSAPTGMPTIDPFPPKDKPKDPSGDYFDYSIDDDDGRGPLQWGDLNGEKQAEANYWDEFDNYIKPSLTTNMCDQNSKTGRQSPIDLRFDWADAQCFEYHQIRSKPGEWGITNPKVEKQILPSKLRFTYPRKFDGDFGDASENDQVKGASADLPKQWGHQLPVLHVDVKIPSEHWMEGKQYAAEYQINLIQNREEKRRGAPVISVLFDIHPEEEDHHRIGQMIDEFQKVYDADLAECEDFRRKQRRLGAWADDTLGAGSKIAEEARSTWLDEPVEEETKFRENLTNLRRRAQEFRRWNPFHETIVRTIWFYGYEGSLTEPPCSEFVEWRIMLEPALISSRQLFQMKNILFNHVDGKCQRTSVHSTELGVARPIQNYEGRDVYQCMCRDFIADKDRDEYGENRCLWTERDQFGFNKDKYTQDWYRSHHKYETIEDYWKDNGKPHWAS